MICTVMVSSQLKNPNNRYFPFRNHNGSTDFCNVYEYLKGNILCVKGERCLAPKGKVISNIKASSFVKFVPTI